MLIRESARTMKGDYIMKKSVKRLMSAFMALVMVLSVGAVPAFAAENSEEMVTEATVDMVAENEVTVTPRDSRAYTGYNWSFKHQRDTNQFYATKGQTVVFTMMGINSTSSLGFNVRLCRYVNGEPQVVHGPISIGANASNTAISFAIPSSGYYFIRCARTNDGTAQNITTIYADLMDP